MLTDKVPYAPLPAMTLDAALARAYESRPDYLAAQSRLEAARATRRAANGALLPTVSFDADFGAIGQTVDTAHSTYSFGATVRVPIFDGGRTQARRIEADAFAEAARGGGGRLQGPDRVRGARGAARRAGRRPAAAGDADAACSSRPDELEQARDRFGAGVASNLEVTQAQESVATASDIYIAALYAHNLAKASLARAMGVAESAVIAYFGGQQ